MYFWVILALKHLIFEGPAAFGTMHSEIFKTPKLTLLGGDDLVLNLREAGELRSNESSRSE